MTDSSSDFDLVPEEPESDRDGLIDGMYSVWDLGPLADPDPEVIARFDAIEKELIEMSEKSAHRRFYRMEGSYGEGADELREVYLTEMHNHHERVKRLKTVLYQMRHGVDF